MTLAQRCSTIELLLLDVDGVLTDGRITYSGDRNEIKSFHVRDGSGIKIWQRCGKNVAILSGRSSKVVDIRAAELDIVPVIQGVFDKWPAYQKLLVELNLRPEQVCFVADDVLDLPILRECGFAVAVADACPEVRRAAHYVTRTPGGRGAVREAIELVLRSQGSWQTFLERYQVGEKTLRGGDVTG